MKNFNPVSCRGCGKSYSGYPLEYFLANVEFHELMCPGHPDIKGTINIVPYNDPALVKTFKINWDEQVAAFIASKCQKRGCECGAHKASGMARGPGHSSWCPWSQP